MCERLEDDINLYTVAEFQREMETLDEDVYSIKMTKIKLEKHYGRGIKFVDRIGKSNIILLEINIMQISRPLSETTSC